MLRRLVPATFSPTLGCQPWKVRYQSWTATTGKAPGQWPPVSQSLWGWRFRSISTRNTCSSYCFLHCCLSFAGLFCCYLLPLGLLSHWAGGRLHPPRWTGEGLWVTCLLCELCLEQGLNIYCICLISHPSPRSYVCEGYKPLCRLHEIIISYFLQYFIHFIVQLPKKLLCIILSCIA